MDRRQQKTKAAIYKAFSHLLEKKRYEHITVQEIIDEANIGRSTFYSHFETKDALLISICKSIFDHVFPDEIMAEDTCGFSGDNSGLQAKLVHILYHLNEIKNDIIRILSSDSSELFVKYFREYLSKIFASYLNEKNKEVPQDFLISHLAGSFTNAILWWIKNKMQYSPEKIVQFYLSVIKI